MMDYGLEFYAQRADLARIREAFDIPACENEPVFMDYRNTAPYTPVPYAPQAAGILAGRLLNTSPLVCHYLARITNLAVWILTCFFAIRAAGRFGWVLFQAALLPMSLSLGASLSADALTLGLAYLFIGLVAGSGDIAPPRVARRVALTTGVFVAFGLCKAYIPMWAMIFMSPVFWRIRRHLIVMATALLLTLILLTLWLCLTRHDIIQHHPRDNPEIQAAYIVQHPYVSLRIILGSFVHLGGKLRSMIGTLGWLRVILWPSIYLAYGALLCAVPLLCVGSNRLTWRVKVLLFWLCVVLHGAVYFRLYIMATPLAHPYVVGVQGRYFLPYLPVFLLLFTHNGWRRVKLACRAHIATVLPLINMVLLAVTTWRIVADYYLP